MLSCGLSCSETDPGIYFLKNPSGSFPLAALAVHVDDFYGYGANDGVSARLVDMIDRRHKIKYTFEPKWLLHMEVSEGPDNTLLLKQESYLRECLSRFGCGNMYTCRTPMDKDKSLAPSSSSDVALSHKQVQRYRALVGSLNYAATHSRPDIAFIVNQLSQHMHNPSIIHMEAGERALVM